MSTRSASLSVGILFSLTFVLCILFGLIVPQFHDNAAIAFLPGFQWLSAKGFFIGLVETFAYGLYAGFVVAFLYNRFNGTLKLKTA